MTLKPKGSNCQKDVDNMLINVDSVASISKKKKIKSKNSKQRHSHCNEALIVSRVKLNKLVMLWISKQEVDFVKHLLLRTALKKNAP